jgi:N-acetylneuraminate lyase
MPVVDAVALARHADQSGADGISSILPPFYRDTRSLLAYFEALAAAVPKLPLFPYLFGGPSDAVSLMSGLIQIPNVAGTKYTGPNMYELNRIRELREEGWTVFSGMDEQCLFAAMSGAGGNIGSTVNIMLGAYQQIRQYYETGDLSQGQELQFRVNRVTTLLHATGFDGALRECLRVLGFECGQPRLPHMPQSEEQREALRAQLDAVDFGTLAAMQGACHDEFPKT